MNTDVVQIVPMTQASTRNQEAHATAGFWDINYHLNSNYVLWPNEI